MSNFEENYSGIPKGFIDLFMHTEAPVFVPIGDGSDPKQGYYEVPKSSIQREMHIKNLIVSKGSLFIAKRMAPGASWGDGINYLELGTGVGTGTQNAPQAETASAVALRSPLIRKAITSWTYIDANGNPTATETNVIRYTTLFSDSEAVGSITEMGLFGGNATSALGSGYMFNFKTFGVWTKDSTVQLTAVWTLTF